VLTHKLFNVPVSFATTRPQVSVIVTWDVLPFVADAAAHHRLPIILRKDDSAHLSDFNQKVLTWLMPRLKHISQSSSQSSPAGVRVPLAVPLVEPLA
jgi:hypothetical protein